MTNFLFSLAPSRYVPVRSSSRVRVLAELKQREELKLENEKYSARPLARTVPFENQFRWSDGVIQPAPDKRRISTTDPNADAENKRATRNSNGQPKSQINEREQRAKKRGLVDERNVTRSRYAEVDSEVRCSSILFDFRQGNIPPNPLATKLIKHLFPPPCNKGRGGGGLYLNHAADYEAAWPANEQLALVHSREPVVGVVCAGQGWQ